MTNIKIKKIDPLSERLDKVGLRGGFGKSKPTTKKKGNIRILVKDVKDRNFIKDLVLKATQSKVKVSEKDGRYIFSGEKMKVNDAVNFAFDKANKRGIYDAAKMIDATKMVKKKNKGGLLVTPKLAKRGY
jgi:hypothetical protein